MTSKGGGRPKGLPKTGGRQPGVANKNTAQLRDMILAALNEQPGGGVEYLKIQAMENPGPFMSLLGKVLPSQTQISGLDGEPIHVSVYIPTNGRSDD